jgi:hypothetical protein
MTLILCGPVLADEVKLVTGESLKGDIIKINEDLVVIEHPSLGRIEIPADAVKEVIADLETVSGDTAAQPLYGKQEKKREPAKAVKSGKPAQDSRFEVGANGSQGNSETFDGRAALVSEYKDETFRIKLNAAYFYGSTRDTITKNQFNVEVVNEWYIPKTRWSLFTQGRYDRKAFGPWRSRQTCAGGVGYKVIDRGGFQATLRAGLGFAREYVSENDRPQPEALATGEIKWLISNDQKLAADTTYYNALDKAGQYRVVSNAAWTAKLDGADGISIKLGVQNEYQSDVEPEFEYNDFKYYAAVSVDF